jgi:pimeloyl-ACP methyl ester carboxylesterase
VLLWTLALLGCSGTPLVDVGDGRQLYINCEGQGSPTVVMEAGGAGHSGSWDSVQPEVAEFTRVCVYDRSGTGNSSATPKLGTIQAIAEELHTLLPSAGVDPPYVLVGHSLGGMIVLQFATVYPGETIGMVMVDTSAVDPRDRLQAELTPEEWRQYGAQGHEGDFSLPEGSDLLGAGAVNLADIPLVVLTAGIVGTDLPPDVAARVQEVRLEMHRELLDLSTDSTHLIAENSDHAIPTKQPEIVVDAISQVVVAIRDQPPAPSP